MVATFLWRHTGTGRGGESVFRTLYGDQAQYFDVEKVPKIKHETPGELKQSNQQIQALSYRRPFLHCVQVRCNPKLVVSIYLALLLCYWWRQLSAGRSLKFASCRGDWGERCWPRNAAEIHAVAGSNTQPSDREADTLALSYRRNC